MQTKQDEIYSYPGEDQKKEKKVSPQTGTVFARNFGN